MKTREILVPEETLTDFAIRNDLTMMIMERRVDITSSLRFSARFEDIEVKSGELLVSVYGDGKTKEEAIENYKKQISLKKIVKDAWKDTRKEIDVPRLK